MIILNEKTYAEECLRERRMEKKPYKTISILAKYYYHCMGYRKKKIEKLLKEYMSECYAKYEDHKILWDETIEKLARNAGKYTLYEINGIWITTAELETIRSLNNNMLERLAFTLLCLAKLGNERSFKNNGWVNNDAKEIFTLARIPCSVDERYENLGLLHELGLLEFPKRLENLSCRVLYVNSDSDNEMFISDFRELGYEYLNYLGGNFTRCCECDRLIRDNKKHTRRYCSDCIAPQQSDTKTVICVDCGKEFEVDKSNTRTNRCDDCYTSYRRKYKAEKEAERYQRDKKK